MIYSLVLAICLTDAVQSGAPKYGGSPSPDVGLAQNVSEGTLTESTAIEIAKKHALRGYKSLERFRVVACEQTLFWRVIFDHGGPEYVIDKESGMIRRVQKIPQDWPALHSNKAAEQEANITREAAINIAKADAASVPGIDIDRFEIFACELERVWRVFVEFKLHLELGAERPIIPHSSAPNYVIDKRTGKILLKQRYGTVKS